MERLKIQGYDITTEMMENGVFINFDKGINTGGYISIKFDDDGVVVDVFNAEGDVINSCWNFYNELEPTEA